MQVLNDNKKKFTVQLENFLQFMEDLKFPGEVSSPPKLRSGFQNTKALYFYISKGRFGFPGSRSGFPNPDPRIQ
jgi:hypothetical protein